MIVGYPPGGGTDIVGRMLAQKLTENFAYTVVVDNRGGATGNIGTELAARATPDGYTILMGNVVPNAINVSLFKKIAFDPVKDFAPISLLASCCGVNTGESGATTRAENATIARRPSWRLPAPVAPTRQ